ncbi:MAG: hypothetical protein QM811_07765 [Pirellulales bacterium]
MSTLKILEREPFEQLFGMSSGYVLDFSNPTFSSIIKENVKLDIYSDKYGTRGNSKANRLRAFIEAEDDAVVGLLLAEFLDYWKYKNPTPTAVEQSQYERCLTVISRLTGKAQGSASSESNFLNVDFGSVSISSIGLPSQLVTILEQRIAEAHECLAANASLACIFLTGSILEGLLLGVATNYPEQFNRTTCCQRTKKIA